MSDTEHETVLDPAQAFTAMRQELALLGAAIKGLIADPPQVDVPDYTETLEKLRDYTHSLAKSYKTMRDSPLLRTTPDQFALQINAASIEARKAESAALTTAEQRFAAITCELTGFVESARTADRQNKWNLALFALGFVLGAMVFWLFGRL
jgi:hypothetical protein